LHRFFDIIATSRVIAPSYDGEESPDSAEQCTGEEPGVCHPELVEGYKRQTVPQKITSTLSLLDFVEKGRMEG